MVLLTVACSSGSSAQRKDGDGTGGSSSGQGGSGSAQGGSGSAQGSTGGDRGSGAAGADATTNDPSGVLCAGSTSQDAPADVWSDARGPFVSVPGPALGSGSVYQKTASGWTLITSTGSGNIAGIPLGNLTLDYGPCGGAEIIRADGTLVQCSSWFPPDQFIVTSTLAYAGIGQDVATYDGTLWTQYQTTLPNTVRTLWADANTVAVTLYSGEAFSSTNGGTWVALGVPGGGPPNTFTGDYPIIWGLASNDLWVGFPDGRLLEFDGTIWQQRAAVEGTCTGAGISAMWGMDGVLYVLAGNRLARFQNGALEIIKDFPCDTTLTSIWGTSVSEVYVTATDQSRMGTKCGITEVLLVNGLQVTEI